MHLQDYPGLFAWYQQRLSEPPQPADVATYFAWKLCEAFNSPTAALPEHVGRSFDHYLEVSGNHQRDLLHVIGIFQQQGADVLECLSEVGQIAVSTGKAPAFRQRMSKTAEKTGLAAIYFLAAWAALNSGDLDGCIDECEKVTEPFAAIHTIHGQALLEQGRVEEAIEVLVIATKLSPTELLAWFQLAKAYHVTNAYDAAWVSLRQCQRLAPQSEEVALFLGMTALQTSDRKSDEKASYAYQALFEFLPNFTTSSIVIGTLAQLACRLEDKSKLRGVLRGADWKQLKDSTDFVRRLPPVLRALNELGWLDVAGEILQHMTQARAAS